ncbi:MAG TPA: serine/threonine-protein kinase [Pirellulales bacterium]
MSSSLHSSRTGDDRAARAERRFPQRLGPWELVRLAGQGQLTFLYQARPAESDAPPAYALKVLRPEWQDDSRGVAILAREVQVAQKVSHQHLVPILAAGLKEPPYYLAMPWIDGASLAEHIRRHATLELPVVFWIARQVAQSLEALHDAGWMHGDVKPENILVSPSGHATLIDLGFARHKAECSSFADRAVLGTLRYAAPEMLYTAEGGDSSSDIYSLGVTLFEMFTGHVPFDAEDVAELAAQHRQELPADLRSLVPHLPTRAARLVHNMLAKQPLRRPVARDVVNRLAALEIETFAERFTCSGPDDIAKAAAALHDS